MEWDTDMDDKEGEPFSAEDREKAREARALSASPRKLIQSAGLGLSPDAEAELAELLERMPRNQRQTYVRFLTKQYTTPLNAVRLKCLDCQGQYRKMVKYCPGDGNNSTFCPLWPFRFGCSPETALKRHGEHLLDPHRMPDANTNVEELP